MSSPEQSENSATERQIANWKFVRLLGKGGMAEVFEVENLRLGTRAALKLFSCKKDKDGDIRERFLAEATLLARLNHPRLVRVFDYGIDPATDHPYFVMDLVLDPSGSPRTLADKQFAGADEDHVAMWYEDLRDALVYIHARGIIHRDIKLQNVLVGPDGHAVLSDFGIAKIFDASLREDIGLSPEMTIQTLTDGRRTVMGSLGYLAPELELGVAASPASDYYALGVLVFYLLTGTWCEPRTDILAELETYGQIWKDVLPKMLHSNPSARECPSWRTLEKLRQEEESAKAEVDLNAASSTQASLRLGRKIAWTTAAFFAAAFFVAVAILTNYHASLASTNTELATARTALAAADTRIRNHVEVADICKSTDVPTDDEAEKEIIEETIPVARGYICEYVAMVNHGEMSPQAAATELRRNAKDANDDIVSQLLNAAASNLLQRTSK